MGPTHTSNHMGECHITLPHPLHHHSWHLLFPPWVPNYPHPSPTQFISHNQYLNLQHHTHLVITDQIPLLTTYMDPHKVTHTIPSSVQNIFSHPHMDNTRQGSISSNLLLFNRFKILNSWIHPIHLTNPIITRRKERTRMRDKEGTPPNKIPKMEATNANPTWTPKGEIIMVNPDKGEIKTFEPITLSHYVVNMVITLTISLISLNKNGWKIPWILNGLLTLNIHLKDLQLIYNHHHHWYYKTPSHIKNSLILNQRGSNVHTHKGSSLHLKNPIQGTPPTAVSSSLLIRYKNHSH